MAKYRQLQTDYWADGFIQDLNPEEKFFYLFLLTNMSTTQCGIYELPKKYISYWTGYSGEDVTRLLKSFEAYGKIQYCEDTKEIIILNWIKYNLPNNCNAVKCIIRELKKVKHLEFVKEFYSRCIKLDLDVQAIFQGIDFADAEWEPLCTDFEGACQEPVSKEITSNKEEEINNKQEINNNNKIIAAPADDQYFPKHLEVVFQYYEDNIYFPGDWERKKLNDFVEALGPEVVIMAIDEAISYNARKFKYIENILKRWIDKGLDTIEKVRQYNEDWKLKNSKTGKQKPSGWNFEQRDYDFQELERKLLGWDNQEAL